MHSKDSTNRKIIMNIRNLLFVAISIISICGCSNDELVYAYIVVKPDPEQKTISEWRPVMRVIYRVGENKVISDVAGCLDEYEECTISDKNNWKCQYEDGTGSNRFGFVDGRYWKIPNWGDDIRYVSRWEYNMIRCKWYQHDNGKFKGMVSCLRTYI